MRFPNAFRGVSKLFVAEILKLIATGLIIAAGISGVVGGATAVVENMYQGTEITEEMQTRFSEAMEGLLGVQYEPLTLLGQKGDSFCILSKATAVYPGAKPYYALVYLSAGSGKAELLSIRELWLETEP